MLRNDRKQLIVLIVIGLFFTIFLESPVAQVPVTADSREAAKWREDLRFMAQEMPKRHKNLFHSMTREQFESAVKRLDERIPSLARHQIIVELMRIVAMTGEGDGHTSLNPQFNPNIRFRLYPVRFYVFSDGLFVQAADRKYANFVGGRVVKIGNLGTDQAFKLASEIVPHDNAMTHKERVPLFLAMPEVLHALGVVDDMERASFVVEKDGKQSAMLLNPAGNVPQKSHADQYEKDPTESWAKMNDGNSSPPPLWLKAPTDNFWLEYLEGSRTVYPQYNSVFNKKDETIAAFARRLFDFVNNNAVDRLILDVRLNEGGESFFNMPVLLGIIKSEKINRRGRFFTIIGRRTFSAAQNLVNELERYTNVIFVGEPTGAKVHFYGDHELITLPNSGITVAVSKQWWQTFNPRDLRPWIAPGIAAELSSNDYRRNNDPAVNAILNYKSIAELLTPALEANDIGLAVRQYRAYKSDPRTSSINTESEINPLGYRFLNTNEAEPAIEIFKLNIESYPNSSNAYDSLGDAYAKMGNKDLAAKSYRHAIELNPKADFTKQKLVSLPEK